MNIGTESNQHAGAFDQGNLPFERTHGIACQAQLPIPNTRQPPGLLQTQTGQPFSILATARVTGDDQDLLGEQLAFEGFQFRWCRERECHVARLEFGRVC